MLELELEQDLELSDTEDDVESDVDSDTEYTLFEASNLWGVSMRWLNQAVAEGKLDARLTTKKHGYKKNGTPIYVVTAADMDRFASNVTRFDLEGIGSKKERRTPQVGPRTSGTDALVLARRKQIEDRQAAKELGVSYEEYLTYVL